MPQYRIHRLRESRRASFLWAPHSAGVTPVKPRDYDGELDSVEAGNAYAAWALLRETEHKLSPGDLLETSEGELRIYKYVGFEEAHWDVPQQEDEATSEESVAAEAAGA